MFPVSTASCNAAIPARTALCSPPANATFHCPHACAEGSGGTRLTWGKERLHADLLGSDEPTNLLQFSTSHNILEDDVIGKVHSSLGRGDGYHGCGIFPRLGAPRRAVLGREVRWRRLVGGRVVRRGVMCATILARRVPGCRDVRWRIVTGCIMCRRVVRWCVLRMPWVRWHRNRVVVLHSCSGKKSVPLYDVSSTGRTSELRDKK